MGLAGSGRPADGWRPTGQQRTDDGARQSAGLPQEHGRFSQTKRKPSARTWQILINVVPNHRWGSQEKLSWGGSAPQIPQVVGRCRSLRRPGPHGHRFGRPLSRPPKASVWGQVQDQPRSVCLVRMIWVKDQHAQHWPWTLSRWKQEGGAPLPPCVIAI